jgi:VWFA-related protein
VIPIRPLVQSFVLVFLSVGLSPAYTSSGQINGSSATISFSLVAHDGKGRVIQDLKSEDIRVTDNGNERTVIDLISPDKASTLTLGILFDVSGSESVMIPQNAQADLLGFLKGTFRPGDRAFVGQFGMSFSPLSAFSDDPVYLASTVSSASKAHGQTAFYDSVLAVLMQQFTRVEGRKALVILSDGESNAGHVSMNQAADELRRHDVTVYTILVSRPPYVSPTGKAPVVLYPKYVEGFDPMVVFPKVTGGSEEFGNDDKQLIEAFGRIAESLRTTYEVICAASASDRDGTFHKLKLKINRKGAQLLVRDGYYAPRN